MIAQPDERSPSDQIEPEPRCRWAPVNVGNACDGRATPSRPASENSFIDIAMCVTSRAPLIESELRDIVTKAIGDRSNSRACEVFTQWIPTLRRDCEVTS
jgi:hypothetical protein